MKRDLNAEIKKIFRAAVDLTPAERAKFLQNECTSDFVRQRVERLIKADDEIRSGDSSFLEKPALVQIADLIVEENSENESTKFLTKDGGISPGTKIKHYRIISLVGSGGMGDVYLADDTRLDRKVALKVLSKEFAEDENRLQRFVQEAKAASALSHPNIITVHEIDEFDGTEYIVSEYVEGEALGEIISDREIPLRQRIDVARQIASALAAAHEAGIIHRDIKPDNVVLRSDGLVKVLDFGLAKAIAPSDQGRADSEIKTREKITTTPGMVMGTPQYMSPEQAGGKPVDHRTDVFSFGILLYELVTGHLPFRGGSALETIASILREKPAPIDEYIEDPPVALKGILDKALQKNRDERYARMDELLADLDALLIALPMESKPTWVTGGRGARTTARNTVQTWLAGHMGITVPAMLVIATLIVGGIGWYSGVIGAFFRAPATAESMKNIGITSWTSGSGELTPDASFSPDSKMIAYGMAKTGTTQIWVKPVVGGKEIRVTNDEFFNQYPVWSPDGEEIAYFSKRGIDGGLWRISFVGGQPQQVVGKLGPSTRVRYWSKTGKIFYQEVDELYSADIETGEVEKLTEFGSKGLKPRVIEISRDEGRIAYSVKEGEIWKVKIKNVGANDATEIGLSERHVDSIAWNSDGTSVVYSGAVGGTYQVFETRIGSEKSSQLSNGSFHHFVQDVSSDDSILYRSATEDSDIWQVNIDTKTEKIVADGMNAEYWADISPDGESIVYQSVGESFAVYRGAIESKPLTNLGFKIELAKTGYAPKWSPDGERVAYLKRTGKETELWSVRKTGDDAKRLSADGILGPAYSIAPYLIVESNSFSWSADGKYLAYTARRNGIPDIWLVSADGASEKKLTDNKNKNDYLCCPVFAESKVVFSSREIRQEPAGERIYRIRAIDRTNGRQELIAESTRQIRYLGLDPDKTSVIYALMAGSLGTNPVPKETRIFRVSLQGTQKTLLNTLNDLYFNNVHLSSDSKTVAFVSRRDGKSAIQIVPLGGGIPRTLIVENDPKKFISALSWSPDGKSLVFGKQSSSNLISMLVANKNGE